MPSKACIGVKFIDEIGPAVNQGTFRLITSFSNSIGKPYGVSSTPSPVKDAQSWTLVINGSASFAVEADAKVPVIAAAEPLKNARRDGAFYQRDKHFTTLQLQAHCCRLIRIDLIIV